jgi:coiled-coil domain-containing protein 77
MTDSICTEFLNDDSIDFSDKLPIESSKVKIMTHYKGKVLNHHAERADWLKQLEQVSHSQEAFIALLQKLTDSNEQVYQLQATLATIQDSIFSEKHQTLKLLQENKELKLLQLADKKRMQEFISLTTPKVKSETFFQDKRPAAGLSSAGSKKSKDCNWCALCKAYSGPKHHHLLGKTTANPKALVRTVFLPNEELNTLAVELDMLKDQLAQEKDVFENELRSLKEEQKVKLEEKDLRARADFERIQELEKLVCVEENLKNEENKAYLRLRYELQERQKALQSLIEKMQEGLTGVQKNYFDFKNASKVEVKEEARQADKVTNEFSYKFRKQVIKHEENAQVIKEQYAELQETFAKKIEKLEDDITNLTQNYKDLEERRRISKNKLNREIDVLQEKLTELENSNREKNCLKVKKSKTKAKNEIN